MMIGTGHQTGVHMVMAISTSLLSLAGLSPKTQLLHDSRATHDMATLPLDRIVKDNEAWMIIQVEPSSHSSAANARSAVIEEGSWRLLASLGQWGGAGQGQYRLTTPQQFHKHKLDVDDLYSPFSDGGMILCRHPPSARSTAEFGHVYLLTANWEKSLVAAYQDLRKDPALLTHLPGETTSRRNPVLALLRFNASLDHRAIDLKSALEEMDRLSDYSRSTFLYSVLRSPTMDQERSIKEVVRWMNAQTDFEQQKWTALGVFTFVMLHPERAASQALLPTFLKTLQGWMKSPGVLAGTDHYMTEILQILTQGQPKGQNEGGIQLK